MGGESWERWGGWGKGGNMGPSKSSTKDNLLQAICDQQEWFVGCDLRISKEIATSC